jgi:hypothetical protein
MYYYILKSIIKTFFYKILSNTAAISLIMSIAIAQAYIWINNNKRKFIGGKFSRREIFKNKLMDSYVYTRSRFMINGIVSSKGIMALRLKEINTIKKMHLPKPFYGVINKAIHNILRRKY